MSRREDGGDGESSAPRSSSTAVEHSSNPTAGSAASAAFPPMVTKLTLPGDFSEFSEWGPSGGEAAGDTFDTEEGAVPQGSAQQEADRMSVIIAGVASAAALSLIFFVYMLQSGTMWTPVRVLKDPNKYLSGNATLEEDDGSGGGPQFVDAHEVSALGLLSAFLVSCMFMVTLGTFVCRQLDD